MPKVDISDFTCQAAKIFLVVCVVFISKTAAEKRPILSECDLTLAQVS